MRRTFATLCVALCTAGLAAALTAGEALAKEPKPKIKKVVFAGTPAEPTITATGVGLGSLPFESAEEPLNCFPPEEAPGNDFGEAAYFEDPGQGWTAGKAGDCIGLSFSAYTETEVVFHLGSAYREYAPMAKGDEFQLVLHGLLKKGKVHFKKV